MASPASLNDEDLVAPISGDDPAGTPLDYLVEQDLDNARKDYEIHPTEGPQPKKPEWDKVIKVAVQQLAGKSKDLRLAVRLTEALARQDGFGGLRDGMHLLRLLVEQCWDRLHPAPDPDTGGMEDRAYLLSDTLSDPDHGFVFPHTIRGLPLVLVDGKPYSLRDKQLADEDRGTLGREDFGRARPLDENVAEDLDQAIDELQKLNHLLAEKMNNQGPNLTKLQDAMAECRVLLRHAQGEAPPQPTGTEGTDGETAGTAGGTAIPARAAASREEAYRQLTQIANLLERLEPHSPIPDLLRRAVELGHMPFRRLIREIVRDDARITEINREFGIKEAPPPESS
jgi:type VI secretion system protein ImpA